MAAISAKNIRERLLAKEEQLRVVQAEIDLLRSMLAEALGEPDPSAPKARAPRANVKRVILELLEAAGGNGVSAATAIEQASARGHELERTSVSSTLSRLKSDGVVVYDGDRYKLKQFHSGWASNVHPHPASKSAP